MYSVDNRFVVASLENIRSTKPWRFHLHYCNCIQKSFTQRRNNVMKCINLHQRRWKREIGCMVFQWKGRVHAGNTTYTADSHPNSTKQRQEKFICHSKVPIICFFEHILQVFQVNAKPKHNNTEWSTSSILNLQFLLLAFNNDRLSLLAIMCFGFYIIQ